MLSIVNNDLAPRCLLRAREIRFRLTIFIRLIEVEFLISERSGFIFGSIINIEGAIQAD